MAEHRQDAKQLCILDDRLTFLKLLLYMLKKKKEKAVG